jgi:zinc protease
VKRPLANLLALALLAFALRPAPAAAQAVDWKEIKKPALKPFTIAKPKTVTLPNGMVVLLMEDRELPLVYASALIRGGARNDPADKAGLGSVVGQVWRTGGTRAKAGDELDDFLEARAAKVETNVGTASATVSLSCLKGDFDAVLAAFDDVLRNPEFREEKIGLARSQLNTGIARRNDDPAGIAQREAQKLIYGADSPYARVPEYATVTATTREDLVAWHRKYVHPDRIVLGVVGDFAAAEMEAKLRKAFAAWPKGPKLDEPPAAYRKAPAPGVYLVEKDDVNQSNIRLVHLGIERKDPDYFALEVMNEVFGGGFSARLFSNVRSAKGLAYAVGGGVGSQWDHPGPFGVTMGTKSGSTAAGIAALLEEVDGIVNRPPSDDELRKAKDAILNSFVFRFDSKQKILREQALYAFYGYPASFLDRYRAEVEKVTAADVQRVAKKHVRRGDLAILVVGKSADFDKPLSVFGPVQKVDITIPTPGGEKKPAPTAGSAASGKALLAKVVAGMGGAEALAKVKDVTTKAKMTTKTPQGEMEISATTFTAPPDRMRAEIQTPMGTMVQTLGPGGAFVVTPMGTQDLPGSMRDEMVKQLQRQPVFLAQKAGDPKLTATLAGREKVGEVETEVLDLNCEKVDVRWFIDPATGRLLRSSHSGVGREGPVTSVVDYSDFRSVEGVTFPFVQEGTQNGEKAQSTRAEEIKINTGADPKLFEKAAPKAN